MGFIIMNPYNKNKMIDINQIKNNLQKLNEDIHVTPSKHYWPKSRRYSILIERKKFLRESVSLGIEKGWLEVKSKVEEEQWTTLFYGLTKTGRNYFGLE